MTIQGISWDKFGLKGESKQDSFEDLCMFLCCRELKITKIESYKNQPGIETEPFEVKGKKYGFQSKFFDTKFDWNQIKKSILGKEDKDVNSKKLKEKYPNNVFEKYELNKIFIYSNKEKTLKNGQNKTKPEELIENLKNEYSAEIEYITEKDFKLKLSKPPNLDLAQLYFGIGDEHGFIKNSSNPQILTFIQSSEYINLPIENYKGKNVKKIPKTSKISLLIGNPGSGKTILMYKQLETFGGLDKKDQTEMDKVLIKNNAIPILVNLKNCYADSLENLLRGRKNDNKVNEQKIGFIYLFDGLDELLEDIADKVLLQISELSQKEDTKQIIISCRSGNINRLKAKEYFSKVQEYKISDLEETYIDTFFKAKNDEEKIKKLKEFKKQNKGIFKEMKDILLIKLFWDTISELNKSDSILDLFEKKIELLLSNPEHRKNIDGLNLLNSKKEKIIELNQDMAFKFQKNFQFRFPQKDIQSLILKKFNKLDYKSVNDIINYLSDIFFERDFSDPSIPEPSYIYQHRRYQEYFLTQKLKTEYEKNPQILRELKIISNKEYFENLFLKYLRKQYMKEYNLPKLIELNLIDVYLGKQNGFGADNLHYKNSSEFIPALLSQETKIFNDLYESENLEIKNKLSIDFIELKKRFDSWNKNNDYYSENYLKKVWEDDVSFLIENVALFWKANKKEASKEFEKQLQKVKKLYEDNKFIDYLREKKDLSDPFWSSFENWIYYKLIIKNEKMKIVFDDLIRKNYATFSDEENISFEESSKTQLIKSFFRVCLNEKRKDFFKLINNFDEYEFLCFLDVLKTINYLPVFIKTKSIHKEIKDFISKFSKKLNSKNIFILFYKKFFNVRFSTEENLFAKSEFEKLGEKRDIDLHINNSLNDFAMLSYILGEFSFDSFLKKQEGHPFRYYNGRILYFALFKDFIELLQDKKSIETIVGNYTKYINFYFERKSNNNFLISYISSLWANLFVNSHIKHDSLLRIKEILKREENEVISFNFYSKISKLNLSLFNEIISEGELKFFEERLLSWKDDFSSFVDRCFSLGLFYSKRNARKAKYYFEKGIIEGILRHGYHKDTLVSYQLVDALEILWKKNWGTNEELAKYSEKVFNLTLKVTDITDGDETWQGPHNVIELISRYDIKLAEKLKTKLSDKKGYRGISNTLLTSILKNKIKMGLSFEEIEKEITNFAKDYDYQGKPQADYYEQQFVIYIELAKNELYTEEDRKNAFKKAHEQVENMKKEGINYYLRDNYFKSEKIKFQELCKKYKEIFNLKFDSGDDSLEGKNSFQKQFLEEVMACSTKRQLSGKYKKLNNYKNNIALSDYDSWKTLIEKTFKIEGNLTMFLNYLEKNHFPNTDFWSNNSKYLYLAVAVTLENINMRNEMLHYLFKNSGYGGFTNIMKSYEKLNDKDMCLKLFNAYLKFCGLLVN